MIEGKKYKVICPEEMSDINVIQFRDVDLLSVIQV